MLARWIRHKPVKERHWFACRNAVVERNKHYLVPASDSSIPRTVFGEKRSVSIKGRELMSLVVNELERSDMRPEQHIGNDRLGDKVPSCRYPIIYVLPEKAVRPSVKPVFNDMREIIGRDVIADVVALVHRRP